MSLHRCPNCGREFDRNDNDPTSSLYCPVCTFQQSQTPRASRQGLNSAASYPVTIALIAACALVYLAMVLRGVSAFNPTPQQAIAFGADFGPLTLNGQWWRLVTSMFVHFGILHIGLNMWCLWNLGRAAEQLLGRFSYLLAYFVTGIFGSIASVYWHPLATGAGASGAIFGMAGVLVTFVYLKKTPAHLQINRNLLSSLGTFIFYNLVFGAAIPGISNAAHIGGLVMGLALGATLPHAEAPEYSRRARLSVVAIVSAIVLIASAVATKRIRSGVGELAAIQQLLASGNTPEAEAQLQQLTAREPNLAAAQSLLASIYFKEKRFPEALAALQHACDADPSNPAYQQQLGAAYLNLGQFDQSIALYQKRITQNSRDAHAYLGLGTAYMGLKQYDSAISAFQKAVALDPKSSGAQRALGQSQLQAAHYADAQATFRRLLLQNPNDTQAKVALDFATRALLQRPAVPTPAQ